MPENQEISELKAKIFGKQQDYNILDVYHYLMIHYGYIPFEDFKKMSASLVDELITRLNKMNKKSNVLPRGRKGMR